MTNIYVDLDGSLIKTDLLIESVLALVKQQPLFLFLLPIWLLKGKAQLKYEVSQRVSIDPALLPYNDALVSYLKKEKDKGAKLILATASTKKYATVVAEHVGIFDDVIASDQNTNLKSEQKLSAIQKHANLEAFSYVGNDKPDLAVWKSAETAIIVNAKPSLIDQAKKISNKFEIIEPQIFSFYTYVRAIRVYQWLKNVLLFVPIVTAHLWNDMGAIFSLLVAFLSFSFAASSGYLFNDLLDVASDRKHPRKRKRPLAAGDIPVINGLILMLALILTAEVFALFVSYEFFIVLNIYFALTLTYSIELKKRPLVDTITLASLYTLRVVAGGFAIGVTISFWLLAFSSFIFLSLAFIKRCSELEKYEQKGHSKGLVPGRGYYIEDFILLKVMGVVSGYLAVVVLAMFLNSPEIGSQYEHPQTLWGVLLLLLYWISRMWMKTSRAKMDDDPLVFALKDRGSRWTIFFMLVVVYIAV